MQKLSKFRYSLIYNNLDYYLLVLLAVAMPFYMHILPYLIVLLTISWILQKDILNKLKKSFLSKYFILLLAFFALHLIGLLYTKNIDEGLFNVQKKLSLLIIPLVFFTNNSLTTRKKNFILKSFIYANLVASIICIIVAIYRSFHNSENGDFNAAVWSFANNWPFLKLLFSSYSYFNYTWLSVFMHPGYFSMYVLLSLYILYSRLISKWGFLSLVKRMINIFVACFFLLMIILLESRAAIIALSVIILFELFYYITRPGKIKLKLTLVILLLLITSIIYNSTRFTPVREGIEKFSYEELRKGNLRLIIWERSVQIIKDNLLFGVGTGDSMESIMKYDDEIVKATEGKDYNAHNEFLEITLKLGLMGGILLLIILILPFFNKNNYIENRILLAFLAIIIVNFFFESMLNRLNGVVFFSFFYCLLVRNYKN